MLKSTDSLDDRKLAVKMVGIVKRFPGVIANDHIDFEVRVGEVHALLGENGAGKTTLMNILYGLYRADEGEIYVWGRKVEIRSPKDAIRLGIGMVHQHFMLIPNFTVAENIILGTKVSKAPLLNIKEACRKIEELSKKYGLKIDPKAYIWQLSVGEQQRVEILKLLYRNAKILILDEPTSVLTPSETVELFKALRKMAKEGCAIIFITHKLKEVFAVADRVTVLRKGRKIATLPVTQTNERELARLMVGMEVSPTISKPPSKPGKEVLSIENVYAMGDKELLALKDVSLKVREGEIVGVAGVAGNGQKELVEVIMGLRKVIKGKVIINGIDVTNKPPEFIQKLRIAYIPENRMRGIVPELSIMENLILGMHKEPPIANRFTINFKNALNFVRKLMKEYNIVAPNEFTQAKYLSGGNIQRLILARELSRKPKLIIAEQPTRGLDIKATEYIRKKILEQRNKGCGILLISEDLDEILLMSDRIIVMYDGRIVGEFTARNVDLEKLGLLMSGALRKENIGY